MQARQRDLAFAAATLEEAGQVLVLLQQVRREGGAQHALILAVPLTR